MTIRVAFFKSTDAALNLWILPPPLLKVERGSNGRTPPPWGLGAASLISKGARAQEILDFTVEINPGIAN
jgi:hypothetical protein